MAVLEAQQEQQPFAVVNALKEKVSAVMKHSYDLLRSSTNPNYDPKGPSTMCQKGQQGQVGSFRAVILAATTLALTMTLANSVVFNFVIVCIVPKTSTLAGNSSEHMISAGPGHCCPDRRTCSWTLTQQNWALAAPGWGMAAAILPISFLIQRIGARLTFLLVSIPCSLATLLSPVAIMHSYGFFLLLRAIQGVGYCVCSPLMVAMTAAWSAGGEAGKFTGVASCCFQLAAFIAMPVSGLACVSATQWPLAYYLMGTMSLVSVFLWALLYRDSPLEHPWIGQEEVLFIVDSKTSSHNRINRESVFQWRSVPVCKILATPAVWAIIVARTGDQLAYQLVAIYMPTYLKRVMHFDLRTTGFAAAAPTLAQVLVKMGVGFASDAQCPRICGNETIKVRIFNAIAFLGAASFYIALSFLTSASEGATALLLFSLGLACLGFNSGGWIKSVSLIAQGYSGFVMGIALFADCFVSLALPFVVGPLTQNQLLSEWRMVFFLVAAGVVASNCVFCAFGSGIPQSWTADQGEEDDPRGRILSLKTSFRDLQLDSDDDGDF